MAFYGTVTLNQSVFQKGDTIAIGIKWPYQYNVDDMAAFKYYVKISFQGSTLVSATVRSTESTGGKTLQYSVPVTWETLLNGSYEKAITISVREDYCSHGTWIDASTTEYLDATYRLSGDVSPTINQMTITQLPGDITSDWGVLVQGKSRVRVEIADYTLKYGATLKSASIAGGGYAAASNVLETGELLYSGEMVFSGSITDSRGFSAYNAVSCTVLPYAPPGVRELAVLRCDAQGNESDNGSYFKFRCSCAMSSITVNGEEKNTVSASYRYRQSGGSYGDAVVFPVGGEVIGGGDLAADRSYELMVEVADALGSSASRSEIIGTEFVTLDFLHGGKGVAIGKIAEREGFEIGCDLFLRGDPVAEFATERLQQNDWTILRYSGGRMTAIKSLAIPLQFLGPVGSIYTALAEFGTIPVNFVQVRNVQISAFPLSGTRALFAAGYRLPEGNNGGQAEICCVASDAPGTIECKVSILIDGIYE